MHHFRKSLMDLLQLILVFICIIVSNCKNLQMFSNYQGGMGEHGKESSIRDYVTLANDPKANLPDSFTICSSIYVKYVTSTSDHFMEVYKEDGGHWFTIVLGTDLRNLDTMSEKMIIWSALKGGEAKFAPWDVFEGPLVPIAHHSWHHICMGLDTGSGLLRIVVNGKEMVNMEKDYFRNKISHTDKHMC